jgi:hypothetical protein
MTFPQIYPNINMYIDYICDYYILILIVVVIIFSIIIDYYFYFCGIPVRCIRMGQHW